ncbi:MAG: hypothetical protein ACJAS1_003613, partial [Oleiphilaceae bacterium]
MFFKIMMTKFFSLFIFFSSVYFIGSSASNASDNVEMDYFLGQAIQKKLHKDPYWSALLHYKSRTFGRDGVLSDVHTDQFFLSETGKTNPASELKATIHAIFAMQDMENPDS